MAIQKKILIFVLMMIAGARTIHAQEKKAPENKDPLLAEIAANIGSYKDKTITLRLRLKHIDSIFEKLYFYDRKNHDIEFDISSKATKGALSSDMNDIHEGMEYQVTFRIRGTGKYNEVIADLLGFKPSVLNLLPAGGTGTMR